MAGLDTYFLEMSADVWLKVAAKDRIFGAFF